MVKLQPAYIVLAHKRPDLLSRLVTALGETPIGVHIDKKSDIAPFQEVLESVRQITYLPRHVCYWGHWGHVAASLEGLRWFLGTDASHAVLITGQCYPLYSQDRIKRHLSELGRGSQVHTSPFPIAIWGADGGYERVRRFYYVGGRTNRRIKYVNFIPRKVPQNLHLHGGGSYWCISRHHADYILNYIDDNPGLSRFFKHTFSPDEMMIQSILANSPHHSEVTTSPPFDFARFELAAPNPKILGQSDLALARASGAMFARKFDDHAVLDEIDRMISGDSSEHPAAVE